MAQSRVTKQKIQIDPLRGGDGAIAAACRSESLKKSGVKPPHSKRCKSVRRSARFSSIEAGLNSRHDSSLRLPAASGLGMTILVAGIEAMSGRPVRWVGHGGLLGRTKSVTRLRRSKRTSLKILARRGAEVF